MNENRRELDGAFGGLDDSLNTGVNQQGGSINTLLRHLWGNNDLGGRHPLFSDSDGLEVGKIFTDFVPSVSVHIERV